MTEGTPGEPEAREQAEEQAALAGRERLSEPVARTGMFGAETTGDTSGYGGLMVRRPPGAAQPAAVRLVLRRRGRRAGKQP